MDYADIEFYIKRSETALFETPQRVLWIPLDITVKDLLTALNKAYELSSSVDDVTIAAANPYQLLMSTSTTTLDELKFRSGTRLYYTNRNAAALIDV
ncbi:hypothetical protein AGMMS49992_15910 [Clostridia bacterium]|nr:hypothetical protein AGMMS49992_15910 [Clostridia bacterium]